MYTKIKLDNSSILRLTAIYNIIVGLLLLFAHTDPVIKVLGALTVITDLTLTILSFKQSFETAFNLRVIFDNTLLLVSLLIPNLWLNFFLGAAAIFFIVLVEYVIYSIHQCRYHPWLFWVITATVILVSLFSLTTHNVIIACTICYISVDIVVLAKILHHHIDKFKETIARKEYDEIIRQELQKDLYVLAQHEYNNLHTKVIMGMIANKPDVTNAALSGIADLVIPSILDTAGKMAVYKIVDQVCSKYRKEFDNFDIDYSSMKDFKVETRFPPLLLTLNTLLGNAIEAGCTEIKISLDNGILVIKDNGSGFDTDKIALGQTTKETGHGIGLVTAIETMNKNGTPLDVSSKIGEGTTIKLDLTKVISK